MEKKMASKKENMHTLNKYHDVRELMTRNPTM